MTIPQADHKGEIMPLNYQTGFAGFGVSTIFGITAQYFKIGQLYIDYTNNTGFVNYLGYETTAKAFAGNTPLKTIQMRLEAADITGIYGNAVSTAKLTANGSSVINFFDSKISSADKATILQSKTVVNYPATEYI
jgi:hypothetical protein